MELLYFTANYFLKTAEATFFKSDSNPKLGLRTKAYQMLIFIIRMHKSPNKYKAANGFM